MMSREASPGSRELLTPYYSDDSCTIYHGDCREIAGHFGHATMLLSDPPYGISYRSNHNSGRRGASKFDQWARHENLPGIIGDDKPLDPEALLGFPLIALFGGNYCADKLPPSRCWLVWDKRDRIGPNNQADCELIWTNFAKPSRIYRHMWSGLLRAGEENTVYSGGKVHPHQKPVALLRWIIDYSGIAPNSLILDPFAGSGSTLRAAKDMGMRSVGIEIEERYCEIAAKRLAQEVLPLETP